MLYFRSVLYETLTTGETVTILSGSLKAATMPTVRFDTSAVEIKRHGRGKSDIFGTGRRSPGGLQERVTSLRGYVHAQSASWAWFDYHDVRLDSDLNEMRHAPRACAVGRPEVAIDGSE